jgi:hypothetical protein
MTAPLDIDAIRALDAERGDKATIILRRTALSVVGACMGVVLVAMWAMVALAMRHNVFFGVFTLAISTGATICAAFMVVDFGPAFWFWETWHERARAKDARRAQGRSLERKL